MSTPNSTKQTRLEPLSGAALDRATVILVKTGSYLYGLNHEGSDHDYWRVVRDDDFWAVLGKAPSGGRKDLAFQIIENGDDTMIISWGTFHQKITLGVPLALEVLFAPNPIKDEIPHFRKAYRVSTDYETLYRYMSSIKKMAHGNFKQRIHALRISSNLADIMKYGRFNPALNQDQIAQFRTLAAGDAQSYMEALNSLNYYEIELNEDEIRENFESDRHHL